MMRGFCPRGFCPEGAYVLMELCMEGVLSEGVLSEGVLSGGGFVLPPFVVYCGFWAGWYSRDLREGQLCFQTWEEPTQFWQERRRKL